MNFDHIPKCYTKVIKTIRLLSYLISCRKFHQAKHPIDMKVIITQNTQMNNCLLIILNDLQHRLDTYNKINFR